MTAALEQSNEDPDRRVAPRVRTLKRAKIVFNNNASIFDCIVRNVSATGALLTMDSSVHLPKVFHIRIGEDTRSRPAKLVYRRELFAGIHFLDAAAETEGGAAIHTAPGREQVADASDEAPRPIRRIVADRLPAALEQRFPWH